jgi:curved DNA-binding protein CbpA
MKKFKEYLIERNMTFDLALKVFGMKADEIGDKAKLKKRYRDLAMQHHPDKGGDKEMAQDVNDAYAVLAKSQHKGVTGGGFDWDSLAAKYKVAGAQIKTALLSNFQPDIFKNYFKELSGYDFNYEIKRVFPSEKERNPNNAGFEVEFFTKDKSTLFSLKISANLRDIVYPKAELGIGSISYAVYTEAYGFHLNKKQKMSQRDWKFTNDHSFFRQPETLFPKKKLQAIFSGTTSKRAFKKRDMEVFLKVKLGARLQGGDTAIIDIGEGYSLLIYRMTFQRQPFWGANGIYFSKGGLGFGSRVAMATIVNFPEEEETAKIFEKIQKEVMKVKGEAKVKKTNALLKLAYDAYKKAKGL